MRVVSSKRIPALTLLGSSVLLFAACNLDVTQYDIGRLQVSVEESNGTPVPNIRADLLLEDKVTIWRTTTTGVDGKGEFDAAGGGVLIQNYYVRLVETAEWKLATGEPNDKPVLPLGGSVVQITFRMVKVPPPA